MRTSLGFAFVLAACGGGSGGGGGTGAIDQAQAEELCRADCQHDFDCGDETDVEACVTSCAADFVGWARADAIETIFECFVGLACGAIDDGCIDGVQPLPIHEEWEVGCRAELAECLVDPLMVEQFCEVTPTGQGDESGLMRFIAPEIMEEFIACLDAAVCQDRLNCVDSVFVQHNIDF